MINVIASDEQGTIMGVNSLDYAKQLHKEREYFREAARKIKDSSDKRVADAEQRAAHVQERQKDTFIKDKREIEKNFAKTVDGLNAKTDDLFTNTNDKFTKQMDRERKLFTQDSVKKSRDFDNRLKEIRDGYKKAFSTEKQRNEELTSSLKDKYSRNFNEVSQDINNKMEDYQSLMANSGSNLKDQYDREREQLVRAQEQRVAYANMEASDKRAELRDRIEHEHKRLKQAHDAEMEQQRTYTSDRLNNLEEKFKDRYEAMSSDYSDRNSLLVKQGQEGNLKSNRQHQDQMAEVRGDFNKQFRRAELEKRRRNNGSNEFADVMNKQQGLKDEAIHNNRIKGLQTNLENTQKAYELRTQREHDDFKTALKEQAAEATELMDTKLNSINTEKIVTIAKEKDKNQVQINNRKYQSDLDRSTYEAQIMLERNTAEDRITRLKETFNTSLKSLQEKHRASFEDVAKSTIKDKNEYMKKVQETRADEMFETKRVFGKIMDSTIQDYEQRLGIYQRENEHIKVTMDAKLQNVMDQTSKELQSQIKWFEDRREADIKAQKVLMDHRESQLRRNFSDLIFSYQKKIDKMQTENDVKMKLITNDYETKLKELSALNTKELSAKDATHNMEIDKLKEAYGAEKTRIVSAYDTQIDSMKKSHEEQMRQMSEYKRLT